MELPDDEKERFAEKMHVHYAQILKDHDFVQCLHNLSLFMHVKRHVRVLVLGDDFMVEMPTHEEKWVERVLFFQKDGKRPEIGERDISWRSVRNWKNFCCWQVRNF